MLEVQLGAIVLLAVFDIVLFNLYLKGSRSPSLRKRSR